MKTSKRERGAKQEDPLPEDADVLSELKKLQASAVRLGSVLRAQARLRVASANIEKDPAKHIGYSKLRSVHEKAWMLYVGQLRVRLWNELPKFGLKRAQIAELVGRGEVVLRREVDEVKYRELREESIKKLALVALCALQEDTEDIIKQRILRAFGTPVDGEELRGLARNLVGKRLFPQKTGEDW